MLFFWVWECSKVSSYKLMATASLLCATQPTDVSLGTLCCQTAGNLYQDSFPGFALGVVPGVEAGLSHVVQEFLFVNPSFPRLFRDHTLA